MRKRAESEGKGTVKGTVIIQGNVNSNDYGFPITDISLRSGGLVVSFQVTGPRHSIKGPVTVMGIDGRKCWQGEDITIPEIPWGSTWGFNLRMYTDQIPGSVYNLLPGERGGKCAR